MTRTDPRGTVTGRHLEVAARRDEPADRLIRRFTKRVRADGVLVEHRRRMSHEKPSLRRRRKRERAAVVRRQESRDRTGF